MIVILTNIPTPYRVPLFNLVAKRLTEIGQGLHVIFSLLSYDRRKWKNALDEAQFEYSILDPPSIPMSYQRTISLPVGLSRLLSNLNPACLILGGFTPVSLAGAWYALRTQRPYILWSGDTIEEAKSRGNFLRRIIRKKVTQHAAAFLTYGSAAKAYLTGLGVNDSKIVLAINSVDTDYFGKRVSELRRKKGPQYDNVVNILFVGHIERRKGLDYVLQAMALLREENIRLTVVGDGPCRSSSETLANDLRLNDVQFVGFRQKSELPKFYADADFLVFPSIKEPFGLVLVEAAASGLPIIASHYAGGVQDVVVDGKNGYVVDPTNISLMADRIRALSRHLHLRSQMARESLRIVRESVNLHRTAEGFRYAVERTLRERATRETHL